MVRKLTGTLRNAVFRAIRVSHGIERRALAKATGMARQTVDRIVGELLERGEVVVRTFADQPRGRRPAILGVNPERFQGVGLAVDDGMMTVVRCDYDGRRRALIRRVVGRNGGRSTSVGVIREMAAALRTAMRDDRASGSVCAAGVALPGFIDTANGRCIRCPELSLADVRLGAALEDEIRVPVRLDDITRAYAAAVVRLRGASSGVSDFLYVHTGEGIGLGIVQGGRVYYGPTGICGEVGHMSVDGGDGGVRCACGRSGCIESVASTEAIVRQVLEMRRSAGRRGETARFPQVSRAAAAGDRDCARAISRAIEYLGRGIANTVTVLGIPRIVVGGELLRDDGARRAALLAASIRRQTVQVLADAVRVEISRCDAADAASSAAILAVDRFLERSNR